MSNRESVKNILRRWRRCDIASIDDAAKEIERIYQLATANEVLRAATAAATGEFVDDPADLWEDYLAETDKAFVSPQGAMCFAFWHCQEEIARLRHAMRDAEERLNTWLANLPAQTLVDRDDEARLRSIVRGEPDETAQPAPPKHDLDEIALHAADAIMLVPAVMHPAQQKARVQLHVLDAIKRAVKAK